MGLRLLRLSIGIVIVFCANAQVFEAVSIQSAKTPDPCLALHGEFRHDDTLIDYRSVRLAEVIERAYGLDVEVGTGPASIWTQRYDIQARLPSNTLAGQLPAMLQRLLVDRFDVKVHAVEGERETEWLVVAKSGLKMRPARKSGCSLAIMPKAGVGIRIVAAGYTMEAVTASLSFRLQTTVLDKTSAAGAFDFEAEYLPPKNGMRWDLQLGPFVSLPLREQVAPTAMPAYPPIPVALAEQLGLRLERHVASRSVLVVDRADPAPHPATSRR